MIHPHLLYGITIWGTTFKSYLKRLSSLQNRAIKQIVDCHWQSNANPCYAQLNILKLNDLYTHEIAKLMFKYAIKTTPIAFSSFFTPVISIHTQQHGWPLIATTCICLDTKQTNCKEVSNFKGLKFGTLYLMT